MRAAQNGNFSRLPPSYIFAETAKRAEEARAVRGEENIISLGIGDAALPLSVAVSERMARAAREMACATGFAGYQPSLGRRELREAISERYFRRGVRLSPDEIIVNGGAKEEFSRIFGVLGECEALVCEPTYPVYREAAILFGARVRTVVPGADGACPLGLSRERPLVIFLCSPNNPTGLALSRSALASWINFAMRSGSLIIFDAAYEAYVREEGIPRSIYELEGARECAIEVCSLSKSAGFTGIRCGWTVVPESGERGMRLLRGRLVRYLSALSNGVSYISQCAALGALSGAGERESTERVDIYLQNARVLSEALFSAEIAFCGGINSPYLWLDCPSGMSSWDFFDFLLRSAGIVSTPGAGFGESGEGHLRLSALTTSENAKRAAVRISSLAK